MDCDQEKTDREWDALYARAKLMLDEEGASQEAKRKEVAAAKLRRAGLKEPPVNIWHVKKVLLRYAATKRYMMSLWDSDMSKDEMNIAYDLWPESKTVYEYVQRMRDAGRSQEMDEISDIATDKLRALLQDDKGKCLVNAKLVMATLERLDRKRFGEDGGMGAGAKKDADGEPMVYQISNVQLNLYGSDAVKKAFPDGGVVDVEAVVKALEGGGDG